MCPWTEFYGQPGFDKGQGWASELGHQPLETAIGNRGGQRSQIDCDRPNAGEKHGYQDPGDLLNMEQPLKCLGNMLLHKKATREATQRPRSSVMTQMSNATAIGMSKTHEV